MSTNNANDDDPDMMGHVEALWEFPAPFAKTTEGALRIGGSGGGGGTNHHRIIHKHKKNHNKDETTIEKETDASDEDEEDHKGPVQPQHTLFLVDAGMMMSQKKEKKKTTPTTKTAAMESPTTKKKFTRMSHRRPYSDNHTSRAQQYEDMVEEEESDYCCDEDQDQEEEEEEEGEGCCFHRALRGLEQFMRHRLRYHHPNCVYRNTADGDVGAVLFNTRWRTPVKSFYPTTTTKKKKAQNEESSSTGAFDGKNKPENKSELAEEVEENHEEDDSDWLSVATEPTRLHELIPLGPPGVTPIRFLRNCLAGRIHLQSLFGRIDRSSDHKHNNNGDYHADDQHDDDDEHDDDVSSHVQSRIQHETTNKEMPTIEEHNHLDEALHAAIMTVQRHMKSHPKKYRPKSTAATVDGGATAAAATATAVYHVWVMTNHSIPVSTNDPKRVASLTATLQDQIKIRNIRCAVWPMVDMKSTFHPRHYEALSMTVMSPLLNHRHLDDLWMCLPLPRRELVRPTWSQLPLIRPDWHQAIDRNHNNYNNNNNKSKNSNHPNKRPNHQNSPASAEFNNSTTMIREPTGMLLDWYDVIGHARAPVEREVHAYTGLPLVEETHLLASGGGPILAIKSGPSGSSIKKTVFSIPQYRFVSYGVLGKDIEVPMTELDRRNIINAANGCPFASVILLGFKAQEDVPWYMTVDKSYYVCPSPGDANMNGSIAYTYLRESMIQKKVVMMAELVSKPGTPSRLVALEPWTPIPVETGTLSHVQPPAGMIARMLPFREEMRDMSSLVASTMTSPAVVSDEIRNRMRTLVRKLTYKDTPVIGQDFTNAHLDALYRYLERTALCESAINEISDSTHEIEYDSILSKQQQEQRRVICSSLVSSIKAALPMTPATTVVLKTARTTGKRSLDVDETGKDWESLYNACEGDVSKWKVPVLRSYCKQMGLSLGGNKSGLLERVNPHLQQWLLLKRTKSSDRETVSSV